MNSAQNYMDALNSYNEDINTLAALRNEAEQFKQENGVQLTEIGTLATGAIRHLAGTEAVSNKVSSLFDNLDPNLYDTEAVNNIKSLYNGLIGTNMKIKTPEELEADAKAFAQKQAQQKAQELQEQQEEIQPENVEEVGEGLQQQVDEMGPQLAENFGLDTDIVGNVSRGFMNQVRNLQEGEIPDMQSPTAMFQAQNIGEVESLDDEMGSKVISSQLIKSAGEDVGEEAGEAAGEAVGETAAESSGVATAEAIGGALDSTGVGATVGLAIGVGAALYSLGQGLYDIFDPPHSVDTSDIARPTLQNI